MDISTADSHKAGLRCIIDSNADQPGDFSGEEELQAGDCSDTDAVTWASSSVASETSELTTSAAEIRIDELPD